MTSHGGSCSWYGLTVLAAHSLPGLGAAEPDVRHPGVRAAPVAGARPVPRAVAVGAQERPALLHPLRGERAGRVGAGLRAGRVDRQLAGPPLVQLAVVPVGA